MSLTNILLEFNVTDQKDAVNRILKLIDELAIEVDHYINSGYWGDVFKVKGKSKIVKLTNSSMEFNVARGLIDENFDHVINIFFARQVRWYEDQPFLIVGEYLENDPKIKNINGTEIEKLLQESFDAIVYNRETNVDLQTMYDDITSFFNEEKTQRYQRKLKQLGKEIDDEQFYRYLIFEMGYITLGMDDLNTLLNSTDLINDLIKGLKELKSIGVKHGDLHFENILKDPRTGNYKLIDIQ